MKRKIIIRILIAVAAVAMASGCVMAGTYLQQQLQQEKELRKENSEASIVEVFHDPANEYITPDEPTNKDDITLRIRTERYNVTKAQVQYTSDEGQTWEVADMTFEKHDDTGYYDFFVGTIPAQEETFYYRFICANEKETVYLDRRLVPELVDTGTYDDCWTVIPGYSTPDWAKGALWYNLNPDGFYNGDTSNDVATSDVSDVNSWNHMRENLGDRYGGDLQGVIAKADHIKSLYVDSVYMNPIFKSTQSAGYGPEWWNQIEPTFGNAQKLAEMTDALHEKGLKVGSEAVLTFTTFDSIYYDRYKRYPLDGASESEDSIYKDIYAYYSYPDIVQKTWDAPAVSHSSELLQNLIFKKEDSLLQRYSSAPYSFDSWRFDCGGWLWGLTEEEPLNDTTIISWMKEYVDQVNPDTILVSENETEAKLMKGAWDSHWNIYFMDRMQAYVAGKATETALSSMLDSTLNQYPRPLALSIYNPVVNHDEQRTDDVDTYMETAQTLILMTYLGSPSIYYGEEINLDREKETGLNRGSSFYAMEWDESNWDYEKYNLYRSLGELRSKYSALKTGAIRKLLIADSSNIYAYGRWNDEGTVITVASQNKKTVEVDVNARLLSVKDGEIFTDWLTGKQYQVDEEGMLHLEVIPGGSVFVTGTEASKYRREFELNSLGNTESEVYLIGDDTYQLIGDGELGKKDKLKLASTNLFGAGSSYALVEGEGTAVLTMRQDASAKAPSYNVIVTKDTLEVSVRTANGGKLQTVCKVDYTEGSAVRIERDAFNTFSVSTAEVSKNGKVSDKWEIVKESAMQISMEYNIQAGFAPISGDTTLSHVTVEWNAEDVNYDDFEGEHLAALLTFDDNSKVSLEDGKLLLDAKKGMNCALTDSKDDDWTFKVKLDSKTEQGGYAGVLCKSDENQWVAAGRTMIDGTPVLFVGRTTDGTMLIDHYVEDTASEQPVVLQLQRIGSQYTALYSYDEESYNCIGDSIFSNFASEHVGAFALNTKQAAFDYVCFGDSVHDKTSVNTPYSDGVVNVDYSSTTTALIMESLSILSGSWEYAEEGYYQTETSGVAQLGVENKCYTDFRINLTLQLEEGDGYAAVGFGKSTHDSEENDGYLLKYTKDNELILMKKGKKLAEAVVKSKDGEALRVVLETKDSDITVYAGQNSTRIMMLQNTGYKEGYICFYTSDVSGRFMNSRITSMDAVWKEITGSLDQKCSGGANYIACSGSVTNSVDAYGAATLVGVGVTDFVTSVQLTVGNQVSKDGSTPEAGILLGASTGESKKDHGINLALMAGGILEFRIDGKTVGQHTLGENVKSIAVMLIKKDKVCQVYVQGVAEPIFVYEEAYNRGGTYQVYGVNTAANFTNIGLEDIHKISCEESVLYKLWKQGKLYQLEAETYKEDFASSAAWKHLYKQYEEQGTWEISDGVISCVDSSGGWASGVTAYDRVFDDFEMEFKYRFNSASGAWAGILLNGQKIENTNNSVDYSILIYASGKISLYDGATKKVPVSGQIEGFKVGDWYRLRIVCNGNTLKVYHGNQCLIEYTDSKLSKEGFVTIMSNKSMISLDDILIKKLGK